MGDCAVVENRPMIVPFTLGIKMLAGISLAFSAVCGSLVVYQQKHTNVQVSPPHAVVGPLSSADNQYCVLRTQAPTGLDASIASISSILPSVLWLFSKRTLPRR